MHSALKTLGDLISLASVNPMGQAIDSGNNITCETIDQRGWGRPVDGDEDGSAICDIGAYEYVPGMQFVYLPILLKGAK